MKFLPVFLRQPLILASSASIIAFITTMLLSSSALRQVAGFAVRQPAPVTFAAARRGLVTRTTPLYAKAGQAEVVLVGCGAPNRGMGWYHAVQMLENQ
jgi:hypothetical protein